MAHPLQHAQSSTRKFGGKPEDYIEIHNWFVASKAFLADFRHRALRHHAEGVYRCEQIFGMTITNSKDKQLPARYIGDRWTTRERGSGTHTHSPRLVVANPGPALDVWAKISGRG